VKAREPMKVTVKLFATLTDHLPPGTRGNQVVIDAEDQACIEELLARFQVGPSVAHLVLVNGVFIPREERRSRCLVEGDELAVFPPIGGG
jgi:molybdopterin converting factor small subunit